MQSRFKDAGNILALDLGTNMGFAYCGKDGTIVSGTLNFRLSRFDGGGMRYLRFQRWLDGILEQWGAIEEVHFEEVRRHKGVAAAHAYGGFMATLTSWCEGRSIPYGGVPVGTIKKHIAGKGNANKQEVIDAVEAMGYFPNDDNEADAIALLFMVLEGESDALE